MSIFFCTKCGHQFPKWFGQCPQCESWGTIKEESNNFQKNFRETKSSAQVLDFNKINQINFSKIDAQINEVNRVLGGGIVPQSLILLGGEPGIGKSTLVLQIAGALKNQKIFYVSGEESAEQVKTRFDRLKISSVEWKFLGETNISVIAQKLEEHRPDLVVIDSIQTMFSSELESEAGSVNQVRTCTAQLREIAQRIKATIFIIGHVTKGGTMAGPRTLEHLVDVILFLEGDPSHHYRFLRALKNRFGSTNEVGVFDMGKSGLKEVLNPSKVFLFNRDLKISGSAVVPIIEGSRSFLIEVQALVSRTSFGYPQRKANGFDLNRTGLLIAVLIKRCQINLANQDVHINIVGGLQIKEPAVDLGVALAMVSAFKNKVIDSQTAVFGEVGLGGEIRGVKETEKRIKEAHKMGFEKIICPAGQKISSSKTIIQVKNLSEAIKLLS
jgi:DNA repair protein RadA/Sms